MSKLHLRIDLRVGVVIVFVIISALLQKSDSVNDTLEVPANVNCACPEETLIYTCNIVGGGNTLWGGTAFNCPSTTDEIILRHSQFSVVGGTSGSCSNGALMARSVGVTNTDCYTSELRVIVSTSLNNTTIRCSHDAIDSGERVIGSVSTLMVASVLDPPDSLKLVNIRGGQAILEWTPIVSMCSPINYNITSNCSSCSPGITNSATISCLIPQPNATTGAIICAFSVQTVICSDLSGRSSTPVVVTIPAQPPSVKIIPHYSSNDNSLTKLRILGNDLLIATSDGTALFIPEYNVTYADPATESIVDSVTVNTNCSREACEITLASITSLCPFTVTVTVNDGFRQKLLADPITIGCTNQFVRVQYDSAASTITCTFLNQLDTSLKLCHVRYGSCNQPQTKIVQENSSSSMITLTLSFQTFFCYTVTASNSTFTIAVEGDIVEGAGASAGLIGGVIVAVVVVIVLLTALAMAIVVYLIRQKRTSSNGAMTFSKLSRNTIKEDLNLQIISDGHERFKIHNIGNSCKLREAAPFKRGCAYYEFKHEKEHISKDKEIILMHKDTRDFFTPGPDVSSHTLEKCGLLGDIVARPTFDKYTVFVQSTGSGARHLPTGSILLYDQKNEWQPKNTLLVKLKSNHFKVSKNENKCTLKVFLDKYGLVKKKCNVFLSLQDVDIQQVGKVRDVILMEDDGDLFTGPGVRSLINDPNAKPEKIFIVAEFKKKTPLTERSVVIHQDPSYMKEQFYVLKVDEDNVQMSDFIERKLSIKFENGGAFYEFTTSEEDLSFYKDVVRMKKTISERYKTQQAGNGKEKHELETGIIYFYWIPGVPGTWIKPPDFEDYVVFIQSTSQGSRCLKINTLLLYKVKE